MAAILTAIPNIVMPTITQGLISCVPLVIDILMSLVYQALTLLGCGGLGVGGVMAGGGIVGWIMAFVSAACGALGLGGGGVAGGVGGGILGGLGGLVGGIGGYGIVDGILVMIGGVWWIIDMLAGLFGGLFHCPW